MKRGFLVVLLLALAACSVAAPDSCPDGTRDGGIGGTGQCESVPEN